MMYYSTGCSHAPHHVSKEWADKYKGKFDQGWDASREEIFERQKKLGVVPEDAQLTERPDELPAWDSLTEAQKKLYARQMEIYAGFSENADWNVGRLLDAVEELGDLDNTLVLYIWGDNGASMEGTITGSFNEMTFLNGLVLEADQQMELIEQYGGIEELGGDHRRRTTPQRGATPGTPHSSGASRWQVTSAAPATRWSSPGRSGSRRAATCARSSPTASTSARRSWRPRGSRSPRRSTGSSRSRWTAPASSTPSTTRTRRSGTPCSTSRSSAAAPSTRTAGGRPRARTGYPWDVSLATVGRFGPDMEWIPTELPRGSSTTCRTISPRRRNLAAENPDKVTELQELWWVEAERNDVLPGSTGLALMYGMLPPLPTQTRFPFAGDVQNIQRGMCPRIHGAVVRDRGRGDGSEGGAEGVLVATADFIGGYALWVDAQGLLNHTYSLLGVETYRQAATKPIWPAT